MIDHTKHNKHHNGSNDTLNRTYNIQLHIDFSNINKSPNEQENSVIKRAIAAP